MRWRGLEGVSQALIVSYKGAVVKANVLGKRWIISLVMGLWHVPTLSRGGKHLPSTGHRVVYALLLALLVGKDLVSTQDLRLILRSGLHI